MIAWIEQKQYLEARVRELEAERVRLRKENEQLRHEIGQAGRWLSMMVGLSPWFERAARGPQEES